ncbi:carboxymuconolactone decarboxylase family protein [Novosphingobium malaysiense]|uniref:Carboxymuconolactone decarboxylase n=1 Tax=Novosphingobium malaysiense TaxID=1348853 RepID=A0A0B1ZDK9_9SPHN|nr:carboxymuconolactone decarboxylase family protein [Novosphingobium malaysiense]KHK89099.1 carboxymuconolactone decarboxylase [Novosphingobium malaysiense]
MSDELTQRGVEVFGELMGPQAKAAMQQGLLTEDFASATGKLACQFAFASVWGRDGLERKQRSLVTIGVLIAQKALSELKNHVRIGMNNGLTVREIEEALIQTLPYVGFPAVASATTAIIEVLREQGIDTNTRTSEEKGLL